VTNPIVMRVMTKRVAEGRPLLVGECIGPDGDRHHPLAGAIGKRIAELAGVTWPNGFMVAFARIALLSRYEGVDEAGVSIFDAKSARMAAKHVLIDLNDDYLERRGNREALPEPARLVVLGRRVAAAFGLAETREWFEWTPLASGPPGCRVAVMPNPLGSTDWWKEPENLERARKFLRLLVFPSAYDAACSEPCE